jgi:hypothetical protein
MVVDTSALCQLSERRGRTEYCRFQAALYIYHHRTSSEEWREGKTSDRKMPVSATSCPNRTTRLTRLSSGGSEFDESIFSSGESRCSLRAIPATLIVAGIAVSCCWVVIDLNEGTFDVILDFGSGPKKWSLAPTSVSCLITALSRHIVPVCTWQEFTVHTSTRQPQEYSIYEVYNIVNVAFYF